MDALVYVVDDDPTVRELIQLMLDDSGLLSQVFGSAVEFLEHFNPDRHACLLLDIRMPEVSGMELFEQLLAQGATLPVIFITAEADIPVAVECMKKGAFDFIEKPLSTDKLLNKINNAIDMDSKQREEHQVRDGILKRIATLTPREYEIMEKVAQGNANKVIAMDLDISQSTVEIHRSRVMHKMEVKSVADLMRCLMIAGKLPEENLR